MGDGQRMQRGAGGWRRAGARLRREFSNILRMMEHKWTCKRGVSQDCFVLFSPILKQKDPD